MKGQKNEGGLSCCICQWVLSAGSSLWEQFSAGSSLWVGWTHRVTPESTKSPEAVKFKVASREVSQSTSVPVSVKSVPVKSKWVKSSLDNPVFISVQVTQEVGDLSTSYGTRRGKRARARRARTLCSETPHALILEDLKLPAALVMALESSSEQPGLPVKTMESSLEETALPVTVMESSPEQHTSPVCSSCHGHRGQSWAACSPCQGHRVQF